MALNSGSKVRGMGEDFFTTGQVAKMVQAAPRTVSKWVDGGKIKGCYRLPGSNDRRIPRASLLDFLAESGMPIPPHFNSQILLSGVPDLLAGAVEALLPHPFQLARKMLDVGFLTDFTCGTNVFVLDAGSFGRQETLEAGAALLKRLRRARLIGLASEDEVNVQEWLDCGFTAVLAKPFPPERLVLEIIKQLEETRCS